MAVEIEINSFITTNGAPATSLPSGYPKVRIWSVNSSSYALVVGQPDGIGHNSDGIMNPVQTGSDTTDGFWSFTFTDSIGYNPTTKYLVRIDSGPTQNANERYQSAGIDPAQTISPTDIANAVWEEPQTSHNHLGTMGFAVNQTRGDVASMLLTLSDVQNIINLIVKYDTNRTKIDTTNKQLIVYDDDCTTILRIFQLLDSSGTPSTDSVVERVPIAQTDGLPTC